jgi:hypothetical protein
VKPKIWYIGRVPANEQIAVEILNVIERARSGNLALDELERTLWRLLERTDLAFPALLSGCVENLVQELRELQKENLYFNRGREVDENQGADAIFNEVTGALGRYLG